MPLATDAEPMSSPTFELQSWPRNVRKADSRRARRQSDRSPSSSLRCGLQEDVYEQCILGLTAAGLAGLSGFGISSQTSPIQTAQVVTSTPDYSQEAGVFSQWLTSDAPQCVAALADRFRSPTSPSSRHEQFQFVRALYIAIPPISRALPPGDSAVWRAPTAAL